MQLACVMGVAAACDIAREDAGPLAAIIMLRPGLTSATETPGSTDLPHPLTADPGSDLLFLVRANGALAPVTHQHPGTQGGDTVILPGPAPAVS